jgi:hypothetical protein
MIERVWLIGYGPNLSQPALNEFFVWESFVGLQLEMLVRMPFYNNGREMENSLPNGRIRPSLLALLQLYLGIVRPGLTKPDAKLPRTRSRPAQPLGLTFWHKPRPS